LATASQDGVTALWPGTSQNDEQLCEIISSSDLAVNLQYFALFD